MAIRAFDAARPISGATWEYDARVMASKENAVWNRTARKEQRS